MNKAINVNYKISNVANSANSGKEVNVEIYDNIGEYLDWTTWSVKGVTYESFNAEFEKVLDADKINIRINSYGGDVNAGLAIYNLIQRHADKNIHTYIDSAAYSMGAVIAQAVKKGNRHAAKNATLLIHEATSTFYGDFNATQLREAADQMDTFNEVLATSMADTMGITVEDFKSQYFDGKDHLMSAKKALDLGLIDDIVESASNKDEEKNPKNASNYDLAQQVANIIATKYAKVAAFFKPENSPTPQINSNIMTLDQIINMLEGDSPISAEQRAQALEVAKNFNAAKFTQAEVDAAISAATNPLQATINQLEEEKSKLEETNTSLETSIEEIKGGAGAQPDGDDDTPPINQPVNKGYKYQPLY